jgi:Zn-finger nucleic acid-binding protein
MLCPTCPNSTLVMSERSGIEIDYCPQCRGVWLDRGELDKLIERSLPPAPSQEQRPPARPQGERYDHDDRRYRHRKSWLSEIFD